MKGVSVNNLCNNAVDIFVFKEWELFYSLNQVTNTAACTVFVEFVDCCLWTFFYSKWICWMPLSSIKTFFPSPHIKDSLGPSFCIFMKVTSSLPLSSWGETNSQCVTISMSVTWISILFWTKMCALLRRIGNYSRTGWLFPFCLLFIIH